MNKQKVEIILKSMGLDKKWLQKRLGMTRTTFYYFLNGKRKGAINKVKEAADLLEVKVDDII